MAKSILKDFWGTIAFDVKFVIKGMEDKYWIGSNRRSGLIFGMWLMI